MSAALPLAAVLAAIPPIHVLYLAAALFAVGLVGVACRRNVLVMLLSVEILLNAANLAFVAFSKVHGDVTGQVFVFFAMTVAAAEVAVGLAIVIAVYRVRGVVDADAAQDLRETEVGEVPPIRTEGPGGDHGDGRHDEEHKGVPGDAQSGTALPAPAHDAEHAPAPAHAETH